MSSDESTPSLLTYYRSEPAASPFRERESASPSPRRRLFVAAIRHIAAGFCALPRSSRLWRGYDEDDDIWRLSPVICRRQNGEKERRFFPS